MTIQFLNTGEWGIEPKEFDVYVKRLKKHVPEVEGILNVVFVNNEYIQALNKAYRKKDKPTDVLSFSYMDTPDFDGNELIGEIYISVPMAREQAKKNKVTFESELNKLFVHGFLHIFDYDHETDESYRVMSSIEDEVLG